MLTQKKVCQVRLSPGGRRRGLRTTSWTTHLLYWLYSLARDEADSEAQAAGRSVGASLPDHISCMPPVQPGSRGAARGLNQAAGPSGPCRSINYLQGEFSAMDGWRISWLDRMKRRRSCFACPGKSTGTGHLGDHRGAELCRRRARNQGVAAARGTAYHFGRKNVNKK